MIENYNGFGSLLKSIPGSKKPIQGSYISTSGKPIEISCSDSMVDYSLNSASIV
jgi:hypothetical protein